MPFSRNLKKIITTKYFFSSVFLNPSNTMTLNYSLRQYWTISHTPLIPTFPRIYPVIYLGKTYRFFNITGMIYRVNYPVNSKVSTLQIKLPRFYEHYKCFMKNPKPHNFEGTSLFYFNKNSLNAKYTLFWSLITL
jgi:hypothetical protein